MLLTYKVSLPVVAASCLWLIAMFLMVEQATAQPKPGYEPTSTHIFPAGGRRGTVIRVRVGGECLPPGVKFRVEGRQNWSESKILTERSSDHGEPSPRRKPTEVPVTYPKEWESQIALAADVPLGPVYWRLSCAQGGTCFRPFIVGDLPEFIESVSNSSLAAADSVKLPVTLNGQINGERDVDYFCFTAFTGDVISCEVLARRLGSPLDPTVAIVDEQGRELAVDRVFMGSDPVLAARINSTGRYFLRVANVSFHGNCSYVYRINLSTLPFVYSAFPAGGRAGTTRDVILFAISGIGTPLEIKKRFVFPQVPPTAHIYQASWLANEIPLGLDDVPNRIEVEPNDERPAAMDLSLPVTLDGRFLSNRDVDWFRFPLKQDDKISINCRTDQLSSSSIPTIALFDADGKELAKSLSLEARQGTCRIDWQAPKSARYFVRVRDLQYGTQSGPDFVYRMSLRRSHPDFKLLLSSSCINIVRGSKTETDVTLKRLDGFSGSIELKVEGLPAGVKVETTTIAADENVAKMVFSAPDTTPVGDIPLRIIGRSQLGDDVLEHRAVARHLGVDGEGGSIGSATLERIYLTVNHQPGFRLYCSEAYQYAHRGSVMLYPMQIERINGFEGQITLQIGDRQNRDLDGVEMIEVTIPPGTTEALLPIYLPETMHINVQSQSQLYCQGYASFTDEQNRSQSFLTLSEKRNMLRTMPPLVKLKALQERVTVVPGREVPLPLRLEWTKVFDGFMDIELLDSGTSKISANSIQVPAGETDVQMLLHVPEDCEANGTSICFRATGLLDDGTRLVSETNLAVVIGEPPVVEQ